SQDFCIKPRAPGECWTARPEPAITRGMSVQDNPPGPESSAPPGPDPAEAGGLLTIDLAAIVAHSKALARITVPIERAAVVKADAYGCGIDAGVPWLGSGGCKTFFVADVGEGRCVRLLVPDAVIYVLNGVLPNTGPAFAEANLRPVINSLTELAEWDSF